MSFYSKSLQQVSPQRVTCCALSCRLAHRFRHLVCVAMDAGCLLGGLVSVDVALAHWSSFALVLVCGLLLTLFCGGVAPGS